MEWDGLWWGVRGVGWNGVERDEVECGGVG